MNLKFWKKTKPEPALPTLGSWIFIVLDIIFLGIVMIQIIGVESWFLSFLEISLAILFLGEWAYRFLQEENKSDFLKRPRNWITLIVLLAVAAKYFFAASIWLQIISGLRILRAHRLLRELTEQSPRLSFYSDTLRAFLNLFIFIILVSEIVYLWLGPRNIGVENYTDALYFTITTLTTTGYGDITVQTSQDKFLVIFIMVFGAALFLKLASQLFRAQKIFTECQKCGLQRHDPDASHCKHCGRVVRIKTDGED